MTNLLFYLLRFSISIATMYLFYRLLLRPLTFYQWNRFFLIGYSALSFIIPFFNIMPWLAGSGLYHSQLLNSIPAIDNYVGVRAASAVSPKSVNETDSMFWLFIIFIIGAIIILARIVLQYFSLRRLRAQSMLIKINNETRLYSTRVNVSPFSFGRSIYFNRDRHTDEELQRILQHEFVHVKQKHTIDLIIAETICIINWFNPFAWMIRYSIRQNLEFIADQYVLEKGVDKKEYQYLLLKVIGLAPYRIINPFNLLNLKKRIAMMNKLKSAKLHLVRFLFLLPMLAVVLLAFRNDNMIVHFATGEKTIYPVVPDTIPPPPPPPLAPEVIPSVPPKPPAPPIGETINGKGYIISLADDHGETLVVIKDKKKKIVKAFTMKQWMTDAKSLESAYGPAPANPIAPTTAAFIVRKVSAGANQPSSDEVAILVANEVKIHLDHQKDPPLIVVNHVEQTVSFEVKNIKPEDIEYVTSLKDKSATDKYGEKGRNGVIEITTKKMPLYFIDGVEQPASDDVLSRIDQNNMDSINVLKDKSAVDKYGEKGKNGVIEISTKKSKSNN